MRRLSLLLLLISASAALPAAAPAHVDAAFWKSIVDNRYAVPAGRAPAELLEALTPLLGSRDPVLRDQYAYSIIAAWVYQKRLLSAAELRHFIRVWSDNFRDANVLRRSFSALALSTVAALDNVQPFLTQEEFNDLLARTIAYLHAERDLRGFDPRVGWVHATAHTADLLKFLARSKNLQPAQQREIAEAIAGRLATADVALTHGEDERLARVFISLFARPDADLAMLRDELQHCNVPAFAADERVLIRRENTKHFFKSLLALLTLDERFADTQLGRDSRAAVAAAIRSAS